jgi:hypothetical protein
MGSFIPTDSIFRVVGRQRFFSAPAAHADDATGVLFGTAERSVS